MKVHKPEPEQPAAVPWRAHLHEVIFEADTPAGKAFDVALLIAILVSVTAVCLESMEPVRARFGTALRAAEWILTGLFTIEYVLRLMAVRRPLRYARSFFGVVDLLAVVPTYLSVVVVGAQSLLVIRALRLLRVFRVLKLSHLLSEARELNAALRASRAKIIVFLAVVLIIVTILGAAMYVVEGESSGFDSIPRSIYWAVVTLTTVGFGDITPRTPLGQALSVVVMVLGYAIIAVPTGIVTSEITRAHGRRVTTRACPGCGADGHDTDAQYCKLCGAKL
jgi:voltage-gated potassium channel